MATYMIRITKYLFSMQIMDCKWVKIYMECVSDEIRRLWASKKMCDESATQPCKKHINGVHKQ
jgi:hypothetical protein